MKMNDADQFYFKARRPDHRPHGLIFGPESSGNLKGYYYTQRVIWAYVEIQHEMGYAHLTASSTTRLREKIGVMFGCPSRRSSLTTPNK
jgi:hypothetical protein